MDATLEKDSSGHYYVEKKNLVLEKKAGGRVEESRIVEGVLVSKGRVNFQMPEKLTNVKVLALDIGIEAKDTQFDAEFKIRQPGQFQEFVAMEDEQIKSQVDKIAKLGVKAVFTTKAIDDLAQHYMAKYGIIGVRRLKKSDVDRIAKATGGQTLTNLDGITKDHIGNAGLIEEIMVGDDEMILVSKCKDPKVISIILRGTTSHILDEYERGIDDALHAVQNSIIDGKIVAGGGAPEIELSMRLKQYASTVKGKEQMAVEAYANALEVVPKALGNNAGLNPIDMTIALKTRHNGKKGVNYGLDVYNGKAIDMLEAGVVEPLRIKTQAIKSATEAACMVLRIDDILAMAEVKNPAGGPC